MRTFLLSALLGIPVFYVGVSLSLPYLMALARGAELVSYTSNAYDTFSREACVNGGSLVYFSHAGEHDEGILGVKENDDFNQIVVGSGERVYWCGNRNGDHSSIVTWSKQLDTLNNTIRHHLFLYVYKGDKVTKKEFALPSINTDSLHVSDWDEEWLLADVSGVRDGVPQSGIFLLSLRTGQIVVPVLGTEGSYRSGTLFNRGFVYNTSADVYHYLINDGTIKRLGSTDIYRPFYGKQGDKLAWSSLGGDAWRTVVYDEAGKTWNLDGLAPSFSGQKILRVVEEGSEEAIVVSKIDGTGKRVILKSEHIHRPVHYRGKVYWEEGCTNMLFPLQIVYHVLLNKNAERPMARYSCLFGMSADLGTQ